METMAFWHAPIPCSLPRRIYGLEVPPDRVFWHTSGAFRAPQPLLPKTSPQAAAQPIDSSALAWGFRRFQKDLVLKNRTIMDANLCFLSVAPTLPRPSRVTYSMSTDRFSDRPVFWRLTASFVRLITILCVLSRELGSLRPKNPAGRLPDRKATTDFTFAPRCSSSPPQWHSAGHRLPAGRSEEYAFHQG